MKTPRRQPDSSSGGWLSTGDIVVRDEDDYLFIVDRKKDMVIAGGFNIYPGRSTRCCFNTPK